MSREITTHKGGLLNDQLTIIAPPLEKTNDLGDHLYGVLYDRYPGQPCSPKGQCQILFHAGNPKDEIRGISNEALMAILIDRYESFQRGPFAHHINEHTIAMLKCAMVLQQERTHERSMRCVEGKQEP